MTIADPNSRPRSAPNAPAERDALIQQFLVQLGALKRRFAGSIPAETRDLMATVTHHQIEALCLMGGSEGMTMNELARAQNCALSTATALVDRLVAQGLAERTADPTDRRVVRITPTPDAEQIIGFAQSSKRQLGAELLAPLTDSEIAKLVLLLGKVTAEEENTHD